MEAKDEKKVKAGKARAESLSPSERSEIARTAAQARWGEGLEDLPAAIAVGVLQIGDKELPCAVLDDEDNTRVLTQDGFLLALGRKGRPRQPGGEGFELPLFLRPSNLKPFISQDLVSASEPLAFRSKTGGNRGRAWGFNSSLLPSVCWVYHDAKNAGALQKSQLHIAEHCEILLRSLTNVAIEALIDEATGFQELRAKDALQRILDRYLGKELGAWAKRFDYDFYEQIFRLRGWKIDGVLKKRPGVVGTYTKDFVYQRIAPGILAELEARNPKDDKGNRKARHHQWFSETGIPKLDAHIHAVTAIMRGSTSWVEFKRTLQRAFPKINTNLELPFDETGN